MTTTQQPQTIQSSYLIADCATHGSKSTADYPSFVVYVESALYCAMLRQDHPAAHDQDHDDNGDSCWVCCDKMVVDPYGLLD